MKIIISLMKGRNFRESLIFLNSKNLKINKKKNIRKLFLETNKKNVFFIKIKNKDYYKYMRNNISDFLIIGSDVIINKKINNFYNYKMIKINLFFISIISNSNYKHEENRKYIIFYTKYKNILKNYLNSKNIKYKINGADGSIENFCILKKCDIILDIISTGKTVKENKIFEIKKIAIFNNLLLFNSNIVYIKIFKFMINYYVKK